MSWIEQEHASRQRLPVTQERALELDKTKEEEHPRLVQEAERGMKPVEPIKFQPVHSPGIFEAEFAMRQLVSDGGIGRDVIFHFWPWGLHSADKTGAPRPGFKKGFREMLEQVFKKHYTQVEIRDDRDMGSYFVRLRGAGGAQFWFQIAVKAVTDLHHALGGE